MTICSASVNFFAMCASLVKAKILAETPILKDFFLFLANGHIFKNVNF